jgi:hypothetical protein
MARAAAIKEVRPVLEDIDTVVDVVDKGLDAVEKGADIATEAVDKGVHVVVEETRKGVHILRNPKTAIVLAIGITAAAGTIIGFEIAKRRFTKKFEKQLEQELEVARKFYGRLNKMDAEGEVLTPEDVVVERGHDPVEEQAAEAIVEYQKGPKKQGPEGLVQYNTVTPSNGAVSGAQTSNVFAKNSFDLEEEKKRRTDESPYVISKDEFMENESEFPQVSITYFAGDDTLVDEEDAPMPEVEATVGVDNLARFGQGSGDANIVYIRNPLTKIEFEVAHSEGKYAEEVLGFIEHSDRPVGTRKFRNRERGE